MAMLAAITSLPAFAFVYEGINYDVVSMKKELVRLELTAGHREMW